MAKEWYLLNTKDYLGGFESDDFDDYAGDAFLGVLDSTLGEDIELFNYDLSIRKPLRAIIEGNLQDSQEGSTQRRALVPIGTCKAGMYIKYKDRYWLIVGLVDDNQIYEKAILHLCNHMLTWMSDDGKIHQRWCKIQSASQYNNGETSNMNFTIRSDQLMIFMPDDDESLMLDDGVRFVIDKRCRVYERSINNTTDQFIHKPLATYEITRVDSVLFDYQDSGYLGFIASQSEQRDGDGYYIIDGKGYWLCEHRLKSEIDDKKDVLYGESSIEFDSSEIVCGLDASIYTAHFYDYFGNELKNISPQWSFECDFMDELTVDYVDHSVIISTDNESLINKSFQLLLDGTGYETQSLTVMVKAFI